MYVIPCGALCTFDEIRYIVRGLVSERGLERLNSESVGERVRE